MHLIFISIWAVAVCLTSYKLYLHQEESSRRFTGSEVATIIEESGDISFRGQLDVKWQEASGVRSFYDQELLSTGDSGKVRLDFGEDRYLDLASNTIIKLSRPKGLSKNIEIFLVTGNIKAGIKKSRRKTKSDGIKQAALVVATAGQKIVLDGNDSKVAIEVDQKQGTLKLNDTKGDIKAIQNGVETKVTEPVILSTHERLEAKQAIDLPLSLVNNPEITKDIETFQKMQPKASIQDLISQLATPKLSMDTLHFNPRHRGDKVSPPAEGQFPFSITVMNRKLFSAIKPLVHGANKYMISEGSPPPQSGVFIISNNRILAWLTGPVESSPNLERLVKALGGTSAYRGKKDHFLPLKNFSMRAVPKGTKKIYLLTSSGSLRAIETKLAFQLENFEKSIKSANNSIFLGRVNILASSE